MIPGIQGWANVPRRLAASSEGLLIFDSIAGSDLGDRIRLTQGWRISDSIAVSQNGNSPSPSPSLASAKPPSTT